VQLSTLRGRSRGEELDVAHLLNSAQQAPWWITGGLTGRRRHSRRTFVRAVNMRANVTATMPDSSQPLPLSGSTRKTISIQSGQTSVTTNTAALATAKASLNLKPVPS